MCDTGFYYVETRCVSDPRDYIITKLAADSARDAVQKVKEGHAQRADNRDFTYTINPNSHW